MYDINYTKFSNTEGKGFCLECETFGVWRNALGSKKKRESSNS